MISILFIDGMLSPGNIWRELALPLKEVYGDKISITYAHWFDLNILAKPTLSPPQVIVGHSLGGDTALRLASIIKKLGMPSLDLLVLCAARYQTDVKAASNWDWLMPYDSAQVFTAPEGVETHNFWGYGGFPSALCIGAVENVCVQPIPYIPGPGMILHGNVPAAAAVHNCLHKYIESRQ